jgi:hypothetical protein
LALRTALTNRDVTAKKGFSLNVVARIREKKSPKSEMRSLLKAVQFSLKSSRIAAFTSEDSCIRAGINEGLIVQSKGTLPDSDGGHVAPFLKRAVGHPASIGVQ